MKIRLNLGENKPGLSSEIIFPSTGTPMQTLHGQLSYVYALDALYAWQLVKELRAATGLPVVSSFKKVNPTGVAVGYPLDRRLEQIYKVQNVGQSLLACALMRSRGINREINFKDFVASSDPLDLPTARLLLRESAAGIIAPAYEPKALALLKQEKRSEFLVLEMDPGYESDGLERQTIFGFTFQKNRQDKLNWSSLPSQMEDENYLAMTHSQKVDASVALLSLKYSHAHAISLAYKGQIIGIAVGQQSLSMSFTNALEMAKKWMMRQHPRVLSMTFPLHYSFEEKEKLIQEFIQSRFSAEDCYSWMKAFHGITLATEVPLTQTDCLQEAARLGVKYIFQPHEDIQETSTYSHICKEWGIRNFPIDVSFFNL